MTFIYKTRYLVCMAFQNNGIALYWALPTGQNLATIKNELLGKTQKKK